MGAMRVLAAGLLLLPPAGAGGPSDEFYCGKNWNDAASECGLHCGTGADEECKALGEEYGCYYYTGCSFLLEEGGGDGPQAIVGDDPTSDYYCGETWIHAMLTCPTEGKCPDLHCHNEGESCFAATGCHRPLEQLVSDLVTTLSGPDSTMDDVEDQSIFKETVWSAIAEVAEDLGVALGDIDLRGQTLVGRRELMRRIQHRELMGHQSYLNFDIKNVTQRKLPGGRRMQHRELLGHERYLGFDMKNVTQRKLASGSSALDVTMVITGDYRPPPYLDLNAIAEDSINRNGAKVVSTLRERGERAGREFFTRVEAIEAVRAEKKTDRPTKSPVRSPTWSPIGPPTALPSAMPSYLPSAYPSSAPSRALNQVINTSSGSDVTLGGNITSSFGYIFNIRTKPDAGVVSITGFDFYTESTGEVTFELWTRLGSFKGHKGSFEGWDLIGTGTVQGNGVDQQTPILDELFTQVSIPGGGGEAGTRAFYLTLHSIELVYKISESGSEADTTPHAESQDIEIWEGESVLWYPFPDPEEKVFYRAPRQYLGSIYYNRLPCTPFSMYGRVDDLPCPEVPTLSPTVPPPTVSPSTSPILSPSFSPVTEPTKLPSRQPTLSPIGGLTPAPVEPTEFPTAAPTISVEPTAEPTTAQPSFSPVVPMRAYIVSTLHNVPERRFTVREAEKYLEILREFLRLHTESSMVLDGIDLWHQELISVDANGSVANDGGKRDDASSFFKRRVRKPTPQIPAMEITLVLKISASNLPFDLLGNMASVAIREHEQELLELLREQQAFYTFFKGIEKIESRTIFEVTNPPTQEPTTMAYREEIQAALEAGLLEDDTEEEDPGVSFGVFVALGVGLLWCFLTIISVAYLLRMRSKMKEQEDRENLRKAETSGPLDGSDTTTPDVDVSISVRSAKANLAAASEAELWDQTKNLRLSAKARLALSRDELDAQKLGEDEILGRKKRRLDNRARSVIIASTDSRHILERDANKSSSRRMSRRPSGTEAWSMVVTSREKTEVLERDNAYAATTDQARRHRAAANRTSGPAKKPERRLERVEGSRSLIHRKTDTSTLYRHGGLESGKDSARRERMWQPQAKSMPPTPTKKGENSEDLLKHGRARAA